MVKLEIMKITPESKDRIKELMEIAPDGTIGFRIDIATGGCSGYKYEIDFAIDVQPMEEVIDLGFVSSV